VPFPHQVFPFPFPFSSFLYYSPFASTTSLLCENYSQGSSPNPPKSPHRYGRLLLIRLPPTLQRYGSTSSCQSACEFTANRISILIIRIRSPENVMTTDARSATGKTGGNMTSARRSVSPLPHSLPPFVLNSTRRALDYELIRILGGAFRCLPTSISYRIERQGSDRGPL